MRVRLSVSKEIYDKTKTELLSHGIEIDEDSELELIERIGQTENLSVKNEVGDRLKVRVQDIVFIESFGRNMDVHTEKETFKATERMYVLENELAGRGFIRVSNSCIVALKKIKKIRPSITMKFVLEMSEKSLVDVTRGYYHAFKEKLGI